MQRRSFIKLSMLIGAASLTGLGIDSFSYAGDAPEFKPPHSKGKELEATVDISTGKVKINSNIYMRHSACVGCYSNCGNRIKIDKRNNQILGLSGNPYNPENTENFLDFEDPLDNAYLAFSNYKDMGNINRGTVCARGRATLDSHYDPNRILVPLKRTDKRGKGKWKPITWEEAVKETVEGGKLFSDIGENQDIEGLRQVYDHKNLIDPKQPEFGPKANGLVFFGGRGDGRTAFASRFNAAWGTTNFYTHGYS